MFICGIIIIQNTKSYRRNRNEKINFDVNAESEYMIALYFFDETELNEYKLANIEQKQVAALVYIDNYDEALESIEDVKRSLLTALIDRKVSQYFSNVDGLVRKIEKDKYFVVFKYKYLHQLEEDKLGDQMTMFGKDDDPFKGGK